MLVHGLAAASRRVREGKGRGEPGSVPSKGAVGCATWRFGICAWRARRLVCRGTENRVPIPGPLTSAATS